jgi:hypothetical protein
MTFTTKTATPLTKFRPETVVGTKQAAKSIGLTPSALVALSHYAGGFPVPVDFSDRANLQWDLDELHCWFADFFYRVDAEHALDIAKQKRKKARRATSKVKGKSKGKGKA